MTLTGQNLSLGGSGHSGGPSILTDDDRRRTRRWPVARHLDHQLNPALGDLGAQAKQIENHTSFVSKLTDVLEAGIGNLVDADLAKESARLQALQVQQQLGAQALSIANQAPQIILSLFRG